MKTLSRPALELLLGEIQLAAQSGEPGLLARLDEASRRARTRVQFISICERDALLTDVARLCAAEQEPIETLQWLLLKGVRTHAPTTQGTSATVLFCRRPAFDRRGAERPTVAGLRKCLGALAGVGAKFGVIQEASGRSTMLATFLEGAWMEEPWETAWAQQLLGHSDTDARVLSATLLLDAAGRRRYPDAWHAQLATLLDAVANEVPPSTGSALAIRALASLDRRAWTLARSRFDVSHPVANSVDVGIGGLVDETRAPLWVRVPAGSNVEHVGPQIATRLAALRRAYRVTRAAETQVHALDEAIEDCNALGYPVPAPELCR